MIQLSRERNATAIHKNFYGAERLKLNKKLLEDQQKILKNEQTKHEWNSGIWGESKQQLLKESNNKCAYCEAPLRVVAYGDVEHYRPKSIYWWLAYNYENYLASCTLCNQAFKRDKFPLLDTTKKLKAPRILANSSTKTIGKLSQSMNCDALVEAEGMSYADFEKKHQLENALLINPYYVNPETYLGYKADDVLKEVSIFVFDTVPNYDKIQKAVIEDYGLDRLELRQLRYEWYDLYKALKETIGKLNDAVTEARIKAKIAELLLATKPFAGMIRYFEKQPN